MKKKYNRPTQATELRRQAEEITRGSESSSQESIEALSPEEIRQTLHELRVHQIELEMQNEELRRARVELEAARERYFDLYDLAPVGYCTLSETGLILEANLTAATLLGVARGALVKWPLSRFILEEDQSIYYLHHKQLFETNMPQVYEIRMQIQDGKMFWARLESTVARDADGTSLCRTVISDITDRKGAEEELRENVAKLKVANNELESFSYTISHDLRAPLRAIDGYSRMILKQHADQFGDDVVAKFNVIRENTHMMGQLIDDLLTFSRVGRTQTSLSTLDMEALVREVWKETTPENPNHNLTIKIDTLPAGTGDRTLIKQVLVNLLSNAVKFSRVREEVLIEAAGYVEDGECVYSVRDNGIGFDMAYYDKLFGVFQRLNSQEEYEGTGVGLAIVQRIITRHGGRVWAKGDVDKGATFYFTLPTPQE